MNEIYEPIIGLEIHVELRTESKMFCGCNADFFGKPPNSLCCPVCLGLPGALPVPNKKAVEWCVMAGLALNCKIPSFSKFDRKNYFYPDLPKGYQISQYDKPFALDGWLDIKTNDPIIRSSNKQIIQSTDKPITKRVRIRRVHMEEDTGKLMHAKVEGKNCTLIDFNRSGVPLIEIVTEPDLRSSEEARIFLKKLHQIIVYLGISSADMEKGTMRLEPNISVRKHKTENIKQKTEYPNYKVEVKNINSFGFVKKAIDYEVKRHIEILEKGGVPVQETRGWDEKSAVTYSQRLKEEAHDYRYFPEPDIPPIVWDEKKIKKIKDMIPELPDILIKRFMRDYYLPEYDASVLCEEKEKADYFEKAVNIAKKYKNNKLNEKVIANHIINRKADSKKISPEELVKLIKQNQSKKLIGDNDLSIMVKKVISANPEVIKTYKSGKINAVMFLVGQVMKEAKGMADPLKIRDMIEKEIRS